MSRIKYECATCGSRYVSKNKLKKHQRSQIPRHTGMTQVYSSVRDKKKTTTGTQKKPQTVGNRAKGTRKNTYARQDETIEPTYENGVIRVLESDWEKIKDSLPEGAKHHLVESTNHHLILFTAEAYAEIDFMMYEMNFCEQEMHYEDLVDALGYYTQEDKIKILDMCELQTSIITEIDGQIIKCAVGEGGEEGMSVADLTSALSGLDGLAIAYGKFKRPARATTTTYGYNKTSWNKGKSTTTSKVNKTSTNKNTGSTSTKVGGSTTPKPIQKPVSKSDGQKTLMDFSERDDSSAVYTDDELDRVYSEKYVMNNPPKVDDRFDFMAQEGYMGGRGYNWRNTSTATASSAPIVAKYHPIYGIKGKKLQVDRYVDLTPLIEADEVEVNEAETFEASQYPSLKLTENQESKLRWFMFAYEAHSTNDSIYIDEVLGDISPKLWTQAKTVGLPFTIEKISRKSIMRNASKASDDENAKRMQKSTLSQLVKKGIFEVNESFEDKEVPFTINVKLTPKAKKAVMEDIDELRSLVAETFEASEGGFKLNVATTPVDEAYAYANGEFEKRGKRMEDYIPHFYESYESLQESCKTAIDVPRIEMPVIDPEQLNLFQKSLMAGHLDVNRPYAKGRTELYTPKDLFGDTERAMQYLYLGLQDGIITDDVVEAQMVRNSVGLLRPTQSQIWLEKLIRNIIQFGNPQGDSLGAYSQDSMIVDKTLAISSDGYILDGHHRYGQVVLVNPGLRMRTLQINLPIRTLLKVATPYGNAIGNDQRG